MTRQPAGRIWGPCWSSARKIPSPSTSTKQRNMDFRKQQRAPAPIHIVRPAVENVKSFKFLSVHITNDLKLSTHTDSVVKKPLFNLRRLKKFGLAPKTLTYFYRCTIESILSGCITAWYGNCTARITGGTLPAPQDTYSTRCHRKAKKIIRDINHPS